MAESLTPRDALDELLKNYHDQAGYLIRADNYFRAEPSSVNLGSRVPPALAPFRTAWSAVRVATNAFADRVYVEDIRYSNQEAKPLADDIREPLRVASSQAVLEALAVGTGYIRQIVLSDPDEVTYVACRARDGAFLEDLDTGETIATMRVHRPRRHRGPVAAPRRVTVYTPGRSTVFALDTGSSGGDPWKPVEQVEYADGVMLMRPLVNRPRAGESYGRAEARDLYDLQDQGSRTLTNISIVADALAAPQRVLIAANPAAIQNLSQIKSYMDSILSLTGDVKIDQWSAAQTQPLIEAMILLSRQASSVSGIPLSFWGVASEANPSSGDAIREDATRLEIRSRQLGAQFKPVITQIATDTARLHSVDPGRTTVVMGDPASITPSIATDAAIKLASIPPVNGQPVVDRELIWDVMRTPPATRTRLQNESDILTLDQILNGPSGEPGTSSPSS